MEEHVRVVEGFLGTGVPLAKIDGLRSLLEENGLRLTHSAHLAHLYYSKRRRNYVVSWMVLWYLPYLMVLHVMEKH